MTTFFYLGKILLQAPWVLLLIGGVLRYRRNRHWVNLLQVLGPSILVLCILMDWVLFDPRFGMIRQTPETVFVADRSFQVFRLVIWRQYVLAAGIIMFAVGYVISAKLGSAGMTNGVIDGPDQPLQAAGEEAAGP